MTNDQASALRMPSSFLWKYLDEKQCLSSFEHMNMSLQFFAIPAALHDLNNDWQAAYQRLPSLVFNNEELRLSLPRIVSLVQLSLHQAAEY